MPADHAPERRLTGYHEEDLDAAAKALGDAFGERSLTFPADWRWLAEQALAAAHRQQLLRVVTDLGPREPWHSRSRLRDALVKVSDLCWAVGNWIHARAEAAGWRAHHRQDGR